MPQSNLLKSNRLKCDVFFILKHQAEKNITKFFLRVQISIKQILSIKHWNDFKNIIPVTKTFLPPIEAYTMPNRKGL
jgi:hypothetical protein